MPAKDTYHDQFKHALVKDGRCGRVISLKTSQFAQIIKRPGNGPLILRLAEKRHGLLKERFG